MSTRDSESPIGHRSCPTSRVQVVINDKDGFEISRLEVYTLKLNIRETPHTLATARRKVDHGE